MKRMLKIFLSVFILLGAVGVNIKPVEAADSVRNYMGIVLIDQTTLRLTYQVIKSTGSADKKNPIKGYYGDVKSSPYVNYTYTNFSINLSDSISKTHQIPMYYLQFPGFYDGDYIAKGFDNTQAKNVMNTLVKSFNDAIAFVKQNVSNKEFTMQQLETTLIGLGNKSDFTVGGTTFNISSAGASDIRNVPNSSYQKGTTIDDFIVITVNGNDKARIVCQYSIPKGYRSGQYIADKYPDYTYDAMSRDKHDIQNVSWKELAYFSLVGYKNGVTADNNGFENFTTSSDIVNMINDVLSNLVESISTLLGFANIEELAFNEGGREYTYYLGLMPTAWFDATNNIFWIASVLSVLILIGSILHLIYRKDAAMISPTERASMKVSIYNILLSIVFIGLYVPIFYIVAYLNNSIVNILATLGGGYSLSNYLITGNGNVIGTILTSAASFIVIAKINIDFITRSVMIAFLHGTAPVFISSLAFNGKQGMFNNWWRQLLALIFQQSFTAAVLAMMLQIVKLGGLTYWYEGLILLYMFIPLNKWFKEDIIGVKGGLSTVSEAVQRSAGQVYNKIKTKVDDAKGYAIEGASRSISNQREYREEERAKRDIMKEKAGNGTSINEGRMPVANEQNNTLEKANNNQNESQNNRRNDINSTAVDNDATNNVENQSSRNSSSQTFGYSGQTKGVVDKIKDEYQFRKETRVKGQLGRTLGAAATGVVAGMIGGKTGQAIARTSQNKNDYRFMKASDGYKGKVAESFQYEIEDGFSKWNSEDDITNMGLDLKPIYVNENGGWTTRIEDAKIGRDGSATQAQFDHSNLYLAEVNEADMIDGVGYDHITEKDENGNYITRPGFIYKEGDRYNPDGTPTDFRQVGFGAELPATMYEQVSKKEVGVSTVSTEHQKNVQKRKSRAEQEVEETLFKK